MSEFERAVSTAAHYATVVQKRVVLPDYWCDYVVTVDARGAHTVYAESAWIPQSESILPWHAPTGEPIAHVTPNGELVMLEGE